MRLLTIVRSPLLIVTSWALAAATGCLDNRPGDVSNSSQQLRLTIKGQEKFKNPAGFHATLSTRDGAYLDTENPFFKPLGTNGRACVTCHEAESGFSVSAARIQERFDATDGEDAIFRTVDGSNNPNADVSTLEAKRSAYSNLLEKGLIRIQIPIPANAEFEFVSVDDPWNNDLTNGLVVFRRPLQATNLKFVQTIMFDGREPDFRSQALHATVGHAEATTPPDDATLDQIVAFETALFTTQVTNFDVGATDSAGATGNPTALSQADFYWNQNRDKTTHGGIGVIDQNVFKTFNAWSAQTEEKAAVYRGQQLFNNKTFFVDSKAQFVACANCHDHPESGVFTGKMFPAETTGPFGGFATVQVAAPQFRTPNLPLYTLRIKATGALVQTTDPGMALTTGLARDMSRFKSPPLRGLAAHAPYFHNGMAATIGDLVDHYDRLFNIGYTPGERSDMIAFLNSL